jgi:phage gp45-like
VYGYIERRFFQTFVYTLLLNASKIGNEDGVQGSDDDSNDDQRPVTRIEPFGHRSRPPTKIRVFCTRIGSSNVAFLGVAPLEGYGPQDLADGEVAIYSAKIEKAMHLDSDGNNKINAADTKDVIVNSGTNKVARVDDTLTASGSLSSWASAVESALNGLGAPVATPFASGAGLPGGLGDIHSGADHFKA